MILNSALPTGGPFVALSASRLAVVAAAAPQGEDLLHVVSHEEPYLSRERHLDMEVGKELCHTRTVTEMRMVVHAIAPDRSD